MYVRCETPAQTKAECLGVIARTSRNIAGAAEVRDMTALKTHFQFLAEQMRRLETIERRIKNGTDHG